MRLLPDPVPDDLVQQVLSAGLCAPSGGNRQNWGFIVVKDRAIKQQIQRFYKSAFDEVVSPNYQNGEPPPGVSPEQYHRQHSAVAYLTDHFHDAPVWIVACLDSGGARTGRGSGASIYPAVQNMLLMARSLGLGATLTTRHLLYADEVDQLLRLPQGVHSYAIIPMGYPLGHFGQVKRRPVDEVVYLNSWGTRMNTEP